MHSHEDRSLRQLLWHRHGLVQLEVLDQVDATIAELTASIEQEAEKRPQVVRLTTHPGVGAVTAGIEAQREISKLSRRLARSSGQVVKKL